MFDDDATEWETKRIDNSRPPLRWIANLAGHFASNAMVRMFNREEMVQVFLWGMKQTRLSGTNFGLSMKNMAQHMK